jgi:hypothetical protein
MAGVFVSPHASDNAVREVAFVGASSFPSGLALGGLAGQVVARWLMVALLGDADDVQHAVDATVTAEVESVADGLPVALTG